MITEELAKQFDNHFYSAKGYLAKPTNQTGANGKVKFNYIAINTEAYAGLKYWDKAINEYLVDETGSPYFALKVSSFNNFTDCSKYRYNNYYKTKGDETFLILEKTETS